MTKASSGIRWLGLEIGQHRYAVDLRVVSHVLVWPQAAANPVVGLRNAQGVLLHDGQPVVVVGPQQVFGGAFTDITSPAAVDPGSTTSRHVNAWLVIFRSAPGVAAHGLRVDRTVGPFRAADADQAAGAEITDITYAGQRWHVVPMNLMHSTNSSHRAPEEALP